MTRGDLEDVRKAIVYSQTGLAKDPGNALIDTGLADAYIRQMSDMHEDPVAATAKARAAATKALELNESLAEAHTSLAMIKFAYDWDWTGVRASPRSGRSSRPPGRQGTGLRVAGEGVSGPQLRLLAEAGSATRFAPGRCALPGSDAAHELPMNGRSHTSVLPTGRGK